MFHFKQIFFAFTRGEKTSFFLALAGLIFGGTALVALGFFALTKEVPASGGEYTEGMLGQPSLINPVLASSEADKALLRLVFSNIRDVAERIEPSDDGRIWKIRLKENIFWHDGEKLTSDDVIFTVQKIQDPESGSPFASTWQGVAAQRLSELELQLSLVNPYAFFPDILGGLYIAPSHIFKEIPAANWRLSEYNLRPVGSGPYKFSSFEKKQNGFVVSYELTSWESYFGEKALIDNFNVLFFPDQLELIGSFNAGQIDAFSGIDPGNLSLLERPHEVVPFYLPNYYAVFLNQGKSVPLKEKEVRMALISAIDKKPLIDDALLGFGQPVGGPSYYPADKFDGGTAAATTSLDLASTTLDQAGWKMNPNGLREKTVRTSKMPLEFGLVVPKIDFMVRTAKYLSAEWRKIGVIANLEIQNTDEVVSETIRNRDYEMLLFGNTLSKSQDLFSFWHSSERFHPGLNIAVYNNKKADALIESIRQNLDEEKRAGQIGELQSVIANDAPAVFLYSAQHLYVSSKNIRGLTTKLIPEPAERFADAEGWYLKTARVLK